ncbi:hypothetical protein DPEC_G00330190 [Dallia pectoralis]|uniref:Uncharacterized protein n=1 Tax=Dallia pectoralis TaxID=75939 RepID=A0ACC2F8W4_DALPE|nr:hypothetical protein DPEC_G00330190 [Dallia pectoralis]
MDVLKGQGKHVDAAIDKAATVVKDKVGTLIGDAKKDEKAIADKAHAAAAEATDKVKGFGKIGK